MPSRLAQFQGIVVCILRTGDLAFKGDIAPDRISAAIQQEGGQEPAHAAVSVVEGMYAEKIVDEHRDQDQRINFLCIDYAVEALADRLHGRRGLKRSKRCKQHKAMSRRVCRVDIVLRILEGAADPALGSRKRNIGIFLCKRVIRHPAVLKYHCHVCLISVHVNAYLRGSDLRSIGITRYIDKYFLNGKLYLKLYFHRAVVLFENAVDKTDNFVKIFRYGIDLKCPHHLFSFRELYVQSIRAVFLL